MSRYPEYDDDFLVLQIRNLKSHTLTLSLRNDRLANPGIYFINNSLEKIQSLKLLALTLEPWSFLSKPHFKVILQRQLPTRRPSSSNVLPWYIQALIQLQGLQSSVWWSNAFPSGLAHLPHTLLPLTPWKPRPSRLLEFPHDEAESMGLSLCHRRQVDGLSVFLCHSFSLALSAPSMLCGWGWMGLDGVGRGLRTWSHILYFAEFPRSLQVTIIRILSNTFQKIHYSKCFTMNDW